MSALQRVASCSKNCVQVVLGDRHLTTTSSSCADSSRLTSLWLPTLPPSSNSLPATSVSTSAASLLLPSATLPTPAASAGFVLALALTAGVLTASSLTPPHGASLDVDGSPWNSHSPCANSRAKVFVSGNTNSGAPPPPSTEPMTSPLPSS
eukprot:CAMPEP_0198692096 /NCGR_PEP_ID=MMETSP1468-20131203/219006_1 /TAXON_ID=1461545 /ORGANISM="Mantoniella sp, Strain CCMP1436" /LENGTH=150 /DNA_ID=CAMNT_0044445781 /DNA_START=171 /DNA_END=619 /DNA_ORIENTATION=+